MLASTHGPTMTSRHTVTSLFPSEEPGAADVYVSVAEAMNPARRPQMEDVHIIHPAGQWPVSGTTLNDKAYLAVYDGHGGRDMVDFLEHALSHHLAQELLIDESVPLSTRLERAFLVTDIHALRSGITSSGATVACCVIQVSELTVHECFGADWFCRNAGISACGRS